MVLKGECGSEDKYHYSGIDGGYMVVSQNKGTPV